MKTKELLAWGKSILLALSLALLITSVVKPTLVIGQSMYPTLQDKDYLLVFRMAYRNEFPQKQDIIVFNSSFPSERILIKRVIAVEGDTIRIENGKVYVNNKQLDEPYIHGQGTSGTISDTVPKGKVFVLGDNRNNSVDSRFYEIGYVDKEDIIGQVFFSVVPFLPI